MHHRPPWAGGSRRSPEDPVGSECYWPGPGHLIFWAGEAGEASQGPEGKQQSWLEAAAPTSPALCGHPKLGATSCHSHPSCQPSSPRQLHSRPTLHPPGQHGNLLYLLCCPLGARSPALQRAGWKLGLPGGSAAPRCQPTPQPWAAHPWGAQRLSSSPTFTILLAALLQPFLWPGDPSLTLQRQFGANFLLC